MSWEDDDWENAPVKLPGKQEEKKKAAAPAVVAAAPEKSWDDEDKEPEPAPKPAAPAAQPQPKPAAKAAAKGKAAAKTKAAAEPVEKLTPEEEKRRRNDEVLKADVGNMKDIFSGVVDEKDSETEKKLATFVPITEGDFEEFAKMLDERIAPSKGNHNYLKFMKSLLRLLTDQMKAEEVKQLGLTVTAIQNEHLAAEKSKDGAKGKKKKAAAKKAEDFAEEDFVDDDLDAFM